MKSNGPITALAGAATLLLASSAALAQRQPPSPEQRLERLERQVEQVQRQVFPRGRPADTAGFAMEPAATQSSVATLDQRINALERQMADLLRQSEESGHRLQTLQADLARLRTDQEQRIAGLEQRLSEAAAAVPAAETPAAESPPKPAAAKPPAAKPAPKTSTSKPSASATADAPPATANAAASGGPAGDPGEDAYTEGFRLWDAGDYDAAITSLRAFTAAYPKHRRVSYANNLIGRALLSQGNARAAAEALLANYRSNPAGERAPDSLYYLGQALVQLGQPGQACKAYQELDAVYGAKVRADLRKQVNEAKAQVKCS